MKKTMASNTQTTDETKTSNNKDWKESPWSVVQRIEEWKQLKFMSRKWNLCWNIAIDVYMAFVRTEFLAVFLFHLMNYEINWVWKQQHRMPWQDSKGIAKILI